MEIVVPVVNVASSLAKYTAIAAISSAVPNLPIGCLAIKSFLACTGSGL